MPTLRNILSTIFAMPLYEYRCDDCGGFDAWRTIAERDVPAPCPKCQITGKRIFSPPALLSGSLRLKQENHQPELVKRDREPPAPKPRIHTGGRPWMLGH
jgi:putative FmdB family regulatory protein